MAIMPGAGSYFFEGNAIGVLLLHGFTGTPQNIRPIADHLARRGYTVAGPRLAGHGTAIADMIPTGPHDWLRSAGEGLAWVRQFARTIFVAGVSLGGTLAFGMALEHGDALAGVACINSPFLDVAALEPLVKDPNAPATVPAPWTDPRMLTKDPSAAGIVYFEMPIAALGRGLAYAAQVREQLGKIHIPALLFFSNDDAIIDPANGPYVLEHLGSTSKRLVHLTQSNHEATIDFDKERIALELEAFIQEHAQP
jgi:carboxylesterase